MAKIQFVEIKLPLKDGAKAYAGATKQREVTSHIATFADNKKLQIKGLRVRKIVVEYEEILV